MKKLTCVVLVLMIIMSCISVTATATQANVLHFDVNSTGWTNFNKIYCHIWEYDGEPFYHFGSKKEYCTDDDGDGIWTYDLDSKSIELKEGVMYGVIFANNNGEQSYTLLFNSTVLGDTAYCDGTYYNTGSHSDKLMPVIFWENQNEEIFGPVKCINNEGIVVGTSIPFGHTSEELMVTFLQSYVSTATAFTGKTEQEVIDDTALKLGLSRHDVWRCIVNADISYHGQWDWYKSCLEYSDASYDQIEVKRAVRQYREETGDKDFSTNRYYFYIASAASGSATNSTKDLSKLIWHYEDSATRIYWTGTNRLDAGTYPGFVPMLTDSYEFYYADLPDFVTDIEWNNGVDYSDEDTYMTAVSTEKLSCEGHEGMVYVLDLEHTTVMRDGQSTIVSGEWYYYYGNGCYGTKENGNAMDCIRDEYKHKTRGDADRDGEVSILDATEIQIILAGLKEWASTYDKQFANVDGDDDVSILDATAIQMHLAGLD